MPGDPLVVGDHGYFVEVVVVFAAEELDLFPGNIQRVIDHRAQVEQQVDRAGRFQFVQGLFLERLEVGEGEFAEHGDVDEVFGLFDGDHFVYLVVLKTLFVREVDICF